MISSRCDIWEFSEHAKNLDDFGLILLANQEATDAERLIYRKGKMEAVVDKENLQSYVQTLKDLICFIRYGYKRKSADSSIGQLFDDLCITITADGRPRPRCSCETYRHAAAKIKASEL
jgi:hypothetical protein